MFTIYVPDLDAISIFISWEWKDTLKQVIPKVVKIVINETLKQQQK